MKSRIAAVLLGVALITVPLAAQNTSPTLSLKDVDLSALLKETQQSANDPGYLGLIWWIPTEYWEVSSLRSGGSEEETKQRYAPLTKYTVVAVAVGKIGIGNIDWFSEANIRDSVTLKDTAGNSYTPVKTLSADAQGLETILKAVFANMMGNMGQNIQLLFFPATDKSGKPIADPKASGNFSITVAKLLGGKDSEFDWKLPLTTLSPTKLCPVGKEKVQANWKFCPWHGVKLDEADAPVADKPTAPAAVAPK